MSRIPGRRRLFRFPARTGARVARDVDEELAFHLDMRADELSAAGMAPDEARRAAHREFGDLEYTRHYCRDLDARRGREVRRAELLDELRQDARFAWRQLRKSPGFALAACLTLALGIGASTAIFSVVDGVLLKPLPYADAERLAVLWQRDRASGERDGLSPANFLDIRERSTSFAALAAAEPYSLDFMGPDGPETFRTSLVSAGFFDALGTPARLGRTFRAEEYAAGRERVVVLSEGLWRRRFGTDPGVVGRALTLDGEPYTVVGVMPAAFAIAAGSDGRDLWAPKVFTEAERTRRGQGYYTVVGRLRPGVTLGQAQSEIDAIVARLIAEHPSAKADVDFPLVPLPEQLVAHARPALLVLLGAAGLLLLIACANVANLLLARTLARQREFAIRLAIGAGRARLARQLVTESVLLALVGGAAGVLVAWLGVGVIRAVSPSTLPRADELAIDGRALAFACAVSLATAALVGLVPALRAGRADLRRGVEGGGARLTAGPARHRLRGALTVSEVALALMLLVGAGLLARSFVALLQVDRGFRTENVLAVTVFAWASYKGPEQRAAFVRELVDRVASLPGVRAAGMTSSLPLAEPITGDGASFTIEGRPPLPAGEELIAHATIATGGYFEALRIPLRRGRLFAAADDARAAPVALVNEAFARRHFAGENAVGQRLTVAMMGKPVTRDVVGVVADVRQTGLAADPPPALFIPHAQAPVGAVTLTVRTAGDPLVLLDRVRAEVRALNPAMPIYSATTLDALVAEQLRERRFHLLLLGGFAAAALALAAVGVYGALSHAAGERTREMAVRMALGARAGDVVALVMRHGAVLTLTGVACGALAAVALTRLLGGMLFGVRPLDPATFLAVPALLVAVAALACYVPARRAARTDPATALRAD